MNPHVECGRHSGIPECCIQWFVTAWSNYVYINSDLRNKYLLVNDNVGYIRCPTCIANRSVIKIKECDCYVEEKEN
tara:strand:- start:5134 stop:5361 length:228 start_codon:yes stop_codon:yes gene_type:complete